jgi:hypothetical protein
VPGGDLREESIGPLIGPYAVWLEITDQPPLAVEEPPTQPPSTHSSVAWLVRTLLDATGEQQTRPPLEARLVDLCRAHRLMMAILKSWWHERSAWQQLASLVGTADAARRVLDAYPQWLLEPPWSPATQVRLIDLLPPPDERPGARPHIDAVVTRVSTVLFSWEIRRSGLGAKEAWVWVHRLLAVASGNPRACELVPPDEGSLEEAYSEGAKTFRQLGAPLPRTSVTR